MSLRIAIVTDVHNGPDTGNVRGPEAVALLKGFAHDARGLEPDIFIDLGDRITDQTPALDLTHLIEVAEVLKSFPCPRVHLRGNHDVQPKHIQESILETNLDSRSLEINGWNLIFLDTFDGSGGGQVSCVSLKWLEANLARATLPTVIFSHQPLHGQQMIGNRYFESEYAHMAHPANHPEVRAIIERCSQVRLCVSGHAHWNDLRHVQGISYLTVQSLTESWATQGLSSGTWTVLELDDLIRVSIHGRAPLRFELAPQAQMV